MPPPYKGIDFEYPGPPEIARAAIRRLAPEGEWVSQCGTRLECYEHKFSPDGQPGPHYGEWILRSKSDNPRDRNHCATVEVLELPGELLPWGQPHTRLVFLDARDATWTLEKPESLGDDLQDFYRAVHREVYQIIGQRAAQAEAGTTTPNEEGADNLPPVTDPTDQRILKWVTDDPDLTDTEIGQKLTISRQAANIRRRKLEAMGYKVR